MCPDSLASRREPGAPAPRAPRAPGSPGAGPASRSPGRGAALRSSSAIATSRRACPSPIGEERYSAAAGVAARVQCAAGGGGRDRLDELADQRLNRTGSGASPCPAPSISASDAPVSSASRSPTAPERDPIIGSVDHVHRAAHVRERLERFGGDTPGAQPGGGGVDEVSASTSADHDSSPRSAWWSAARGTSRPKKNSRKSARSPWSQLCRLYCLPAPGSRVPQATAQVGAVDLPARSGHGAMTGRSRHALYPLRLGGGQDARPRWRRRRTRRAPPARSRWRPEPRGRRRQLVIGVRGGALRPAGRPEPRPSNVTTR